MRSVNDRVTEKERERARERSCICLYISREDMNPAGLTGVASGGGSKEVTGLKRTGSLHSTASISSLQASKSSSMESLESSMSTNDCPPGK